MSSKTLCCCDVRIADVLTDHGRLGRVSQWLYCRHVPYETQQENKQSLHMDIHAKYQQNFLLLLLGCDAKPL